MVLNLAMNSLLSHNPSKCTQLTPGQYHAIRPIMAVMFDRVKRNRLWGLSGRLPHKPPSMFRQTGCDFDQWLENGSGHRHETKFNQKSN